VHVTPQAPQFFGSVAVGTQAPLHSAVPVGQAPTQAPAAQTSPAPQALAQAPQFRTSVRVSRQTPPHEV
jgi:hypothetical protein